MPDSGGPILIVVPARGGSKGLPGKNLATVAGVSLVGRAIVRAREFVIRSAVGDRATVIVDTDDSAIAEEGRRWGASVPFLRPASLAADATPTSDSLAHLIGRIDDDPETVVLLQPTSPLARAAEVSDSWARYRSGAFPSVVTVVEMAHPPALALVEEENGRLGWWSGTPPGEVRRQGHATAFWPSGAVYVVNAAWFLEHRDFISAGNTAGVRVDHTRAIDVDDRHDLRRARLEALHSPDVPDANPEPGGLVDGGPTIHDTIELVLDRLAGGGDLAGVRLMGNGGPDVMEVLGQIPAIRSIFGIPVLWEAGGSSPDASGAARLLGALVTGAGTPNSGKLIQEWYEKAGDQ